MAATGAGPGTGKPERGPIGNLTRGVGLRLRAFYHKAVAGKLKYVAVTAVGVAVGVDLYRFCASCMRLDTMDRLKDLLSMNTEVVDYNSAGAEPTIIYDARGRVVATLQSENMSLENVSDHMWEAVVASEDRRFFRHHGVDFKGVLRAVMSLGHSGGGSTITQQLVKNVLLSHDRTVTRKLVEMMLAVWIEMQMSKPKILEEYLNNVYWGHGLYGISSAAAAYFRKRPKDLNLEESAMLACMLPAPEWLSPFRNPDALLQARQEVFNCMEQTCFITEEECATMKAKGLPRTLTVAPSIGNPVDFGLSDKNSGSNVTPYRAPYFVSEVLFQLRDLCGDVLQRKGGLRIETTLDLTLQERAEKIIREDKAHPVRGKPEQAGEAALVALEPNSGAVRVMVGGRDYGASPYNRAVLASRSPGSAFKPVVFLAALNEGIVSASSLLEDEETEFDTWDQYKPQNFYRTFKGTVSIKDSLAESLNVPTVKIADMVGPQKIVDTARKLGIRSDLPPNLSLALGACEVTPLEMACMYATIAAQGTYSRPYMVTRVTDRNGSIIYRQKPQRRRAFSEEPCKEIHKMLRAAVVKGTGKAAASGWAASAAAGKTGTSDNYRDAWFAGYTPGLACVVWVGHDDNTALLGSGAILAAPLWARFMRSAQGSGLSGEKGTNRRRSHARWRHT